MSSSRDQSSSQFGRSPSSGSGTAGVDGPIIGAAASIIVDGITERESGKTPPPPPVSVRTVVTAVVALLIFGLLLIAFITRVLHAPLTAAG